MTARKICYKIKIAKTQEMGGETLDYDLLKVKMKKNKITYESMAKMLGITLNGFSNKINQTNSSGFYVDEANLIRKTLNLSREETFTIFFNN